ncbi:MAG: LuxR C-terminal-related transcriptional regulator [Dehalococcoidia bacterium]
MAAKLQSLTPREQQVLQLACQGLVDQTIADRLVISPRTVVFHKTNIYQKLGIADLATAPRQRALGTYCQALAHSSDDRGIAPSTTEVMLPAAADASGDSAGDDMGMEPESTPAAKPRKTPLPLVSWQGLAALVLTAVVAAVIGAAFASSRSEPTITHSVGESVTPTLNPTSDVTAMLAGRRPSGIPGAGFIRGTVTGAEGQPLSGIHVYACPLPPSDCGYGVTDPDGNYSVWVRNGNYWSSLVERMMVEHPTDTGVPEDSLRVERWRQGICSPLAMTS